MARSEITTSGMAGDSSDSLEDAGVSRSNPDALAALKMKRAAADLEIKICQACHKATLNEEGRGVAKVYVYELQKWLTLLHEAIGD